MPNVDLFGACHKAIRIALSELVILLSRTDPRDEAGSARALHALDETLAFCDLHLTHEREHLRPALASRQKGPLTAFDARHEMLRTMLAEVRALAKSGFSRTLVLHTTKLVAESFSRMAEREEVIQPLLEKLFDERELRALVAAFPKEAA